MIFVFGSNKAGRHGAGSARRALYQYGAKYGRGIGPQGNSYAIPTKGYDMEVLPLEEIQGHVEDFLTYARQHPEEKFHVVRVGCGLAGYTSEQIAPMFRGCPSNVELHKDWKAILSRLAKNC